MMRQNGARSSPPSKDQPHDGGLVMFGNRCLGYVGCGHTTNWTCACTCDEEIERDEHVAPRAVAQPNPPSEIERLKWQVEGMARYVQHDAGCEANDLDYLDKTPCTCGLRGFYNPKGTP